MLSPGIEPIAALYGVREPVARLAAWRIDEMMV
jgi:hypothetical protein